jgi:hypothetical protein
MEDPMRPDLETRRALPVLALLLGLGAAACSFTDNGGIGPVAAGGTGSGGSSPGSGAGSGVEGIVFLTHDESSANVAVYMIWTEQEAPSGPGGGVEAGAIAVPVPDGATPTGARVAVTTTDATGYFLHPRSNRGAVTIRVGALPGTCRRPRDRVVSVEPGRLARVQLDVLCYGPKGAPPPIE